jgi:hypothetical protein
MPGANVLHQLNNDCITVRFTLGLFLLLVVSLPAYTKVAA